MRVAPVLIATLLGACGFSSSLVPADGGTEELSVGFDTDQSVEDEASDLVMVPVSLSSVTDVVVTVGYAIADGSARLGEDYDATSGTLQFSPGERTKYIPVQILADGTEEPDESLELQLTDVSGAKLRADKHELVINSDILSRVKFTVLASNAPESQDVTLEIALDVASKSTVKVDYVIAGTATAADYSLHAGSVLFLPGVTTEQINLGPIDDLLDEDPESVIVTLTNPVEAIVKPSEGVRTHTIDDNDDPPSVQFTTAMSSVAESAGTVNLVVELSAISGRNVTVPYLTIGSSAAADDFSYITPSPFVIPAGTKMVNLAIAIVEDTRDEFDETFTTVLGTPTNASLGAQMNHALEITDNDDLPSVSFDPAEVDGQADEGTIAPASTFVSYKVKLSAVSGKTVTVPIDFSGLADTGGAGTDFTATGVPVIFAPGEVVKSITLEIFADATGEADDTIIMDIANTPSITNATRGTPMRRTHTILNDDIL